MISSWAKSVSFSGVCLTEANESIYTQCNGNLLFKNGFYKESVIFVIGLYMFYFPMRRPEMLDSGDASCLVMEEEQLRGASVPWGHVQRLAARAPSLFSDRKHSYPCCIKAGKSNMNACLARPLGQTFRDLLQSHFKSSSHHVSQTFSLIYLAPNLLYPHPRLQISSFISCFPVPFLYTSEHKLRIQSTSRCTLIT